MAKKAAEKEPEFTLPHPREREELLGHQQVEQHLLSLFNAGRFPHALLLTGERGIGKATLAYRLARFLLSPQEASGGLFGDALPPESLRIGPEKETFKRVAAGSHADLLVIEGNDIKVDDTRSVAGFLSMTPAESDWRVVIIDAADAMNRNAANALLKILEEPPMRAVLILISHNPGMLLPTIRSRCRMIRLMPLHEKDFYTVLSWGGSNITQEEQRALMLLSGGSVGVGLALHARSALSLYQELLQLLLSPETVSLHSFAERLGRKESEEQFQVLCRLLPWLISRMTTHETSPPSEVFDGEYEQLAALRQLKNISQWLTLWEVIGTTLNDCIKLYLDRKQTVLTLMREIVA